jgi:hypothetical protein
MTSTVTQLAPRGGVPRPTPNLPPIARDQLDDARELLAAFAAKQSGELDAPYAGLAEDLAAALKVLLAMLIRPQRRELTAWQRLPLEQARQYLDQLACLPRDSETDVARQLGRLEVHTAKVIDLVDALVQPW